MIANGYRQGPGKDSLGQGIAASKVYANAGLKKLSNRFKKSGGYQPTAANLRVRRFDMPRYNKLDDEGRQQYADTSLAHEEGKALIDQLTKDNANQYRRGRDSENGRQVNSSRATRKREHQLELDAACPPIPAPVLAFAPYRRRGSSAIRWHSYLAAYAQA